MSYMRYHCLVPTEAVYTDNPAYLSASTLASPASTLQRSTPYDDPKQSLDIPNPMYATSTISSLASPTKKNDNFTLSTGEENPYDSLTSGEDLNGSARNSLLCARSNTGQYDNLYTFDPTEDGIQDNPDSTVPLKDTPYVTMKPQCGQFPRGPTTMENYYEFSEEVPVENPYDHIPGDQDTPSDGIYEKLPSEKWTNGITWALGITIYGNFFKPMCTCVII